MYCVNPVAGGERSLHLTSPTIYNVCLFLAAVEGLSLLFSVLVPDSTKN